MEHLLSNCEEHYHYCKLLGEWIEDVVEHEGEQQVEGNADSSVVAIVYDQIEDGTLQTGIC